MMRHLCDACSGLKVGDKKLSVFPSKPQLRVLESTSDPVFTGVAYLLESAGGSISRKPCHFCALILRSLRNHQVIGTKIEEFLTSPPGVPVTLCLSEEEEDEFSVIAMCGAVVGHPIKLSLGTGQQSAACC